MSKLPETWFDFYTRMQPKNGDRFVDDRGQIWSWQDDDNGFCLENGTTVVDISPGWGGTVLTCTLRPYAEPKGWPALYCTNYSWNIGKRLFETKMQAERHYPGLDIIWPAKQNADGSYDIKELK